MSRLIPHPPYAEDQPLSHTILATHVLHRGFQTGATLGMLTACTRSLLRARNPTATPTGRLRPVLGDLLLRSTGVTGVGAVIGTGVAAGMVTARMMGKEEIEWQDRSWRLLENQGQMEVDGWSVGGMGLGVAAVVALGRRNGEVLGWRRVLGGAGLGNMAGVMGYLGWRYAVRGGHGRGSIG